MRDYLPVIEAFEPTYVEEMRGIAEGADVPFEEVVLLNARTEILKLARAATCARGLPRASDEPGRLHRRRDPARSAAPTAG